MRIVHVVEGLDDSYGGPAKSVPFLAHYCRNHGAEPLLLSTRYAGCDSNEVIADKGLPWEVYDTRGPAKLRYSPGLRDRLTELASQADGRTIFHLHNLWNLVSYETYRAARQFGVPLVISPRGSLFPWSLSQGRVRKQFAWWLFQKRALKFATVHVTADEEADQVRKMGVGDRITQIRNGIELDAEEGPQVARQDAIAALGLELNRRYALFLSRLHKKKGLDLLFDAWAKCTETAGWKLLIAGDTNDQSYAAELRAQVKSLGIDKNVDFVGFVGAERKAQLFAASELFILPSHTENFGIVVAEALAKGLPVLTTMGTPWRELIEFKSGWYVETHRAAIGSALSEALASSKEELASMGRRGQDLAARYSWGEIGEEMYASYQKVLVASR